MTTSICRAIFRAFYVRSLQIPYYSAFFIESYEGFDTPYFETVPHWDCIVPILGLKRSHTGTQEQRHTLQSFHDESTLRFTPLGR